MVEWFRKLSESERAEWMEAFTEADRRHDYYKTHERPMTLMQRTIEYEKKRSVIHY